MGESRKEDDIFGDGFSIHKENGETEHFTKNIIFGGYSSDKGTRVDEHLLDDGFSVTQSDGRREDFQRSTLFFDGYSGSRGTTVQPGLFGGTNIYSPDDSYSSDISSSGGYGAPYSDSYGGYDGFYRQQGGFSPPYIGYGGGYIPAVHVETRPTLKERFQKDKLGFFLITFSWLLFVGCVVFILVPFFAGNDGSSLINSSYLLSFDCKSAMKITAVTLGIFGFCTHITDSRQQSMALLCSVAWILALSWLGYKTASLQYGSQSFPALNGVGTVILITGMALAICTDLATLLYKVKHAQKTSLKKKPPVAEIVFTFLFIAISFICTYFVLNENLYFSFISRYPHALWIAPCVVILMKRLGDYGNLGEVWFATSLACICQCGVLWLAPKGEGWFLISIVANCIVCILFGVAYNHCEALHFLLLPVSFLIFYIVTCHVFYWLNDYDQELFLLYNSCKMATSFVIIAAASCVTIRELIIRQVTSKKS